jgi:4-hydroxybenzoate polyprenyltransferase
VAPITDLCVGMFMHCDMEFMTPKHHSDLLARYGTFFGSLDRQGITPGMRLEVALILVGCFTYFKFKTKSFLRSLLFTWVGYTLIFAYLATPFFIDFLFGVFGIEFPMTEATFADFFGLSIIVVGCVVLFLASPASFKELIRDIRPLRLAYFVGMFFLGFLFGARGGLFELTADNLFSLVLAPLSIAFAWIYCVVANNIEDVEIDRLSNASRPLITESVTLKIYRNIGYICLVVALVSGFLVSLKALFLITVFIGNYFLYSNPPCRLKRVPIISKMIIGMNSWLLLLMGYLLVAQSVESFPKEIAVYLIVGFGLAINFIDLKDVEGDRAAKINTLPVMLGLGRAKVLIGGFFLVIYIVTYFVIDRLVEVPLYTLGVLGGAGLLQCLLINRKNYNEKPVFGVILSSMVVVGLLIVTAYI